MSDRKVLPMSERLQIICFLIWGVGINSTLKVVFLTEIIYGAKGSICKLVNGRKTHDFCSRMLKTSNYSLKNERSKKDVIEILSMLKDKGFIGINGLKIEAVSEFCGTVNLSYLSELLAKKMAPLAEMTDDSFLEEVIKYAKDC